MATSATTETKLYDCPICIGGEWRASTGRRETLLNPATAQPVTTVPYCTAEEVSAAVGAAQAAFETWRQVPVVERSHVFFRYRELLLKHSEEIARITTLEHGKTLDESRASLGRGIEAVEFATSVPTLLMGDTAGDISRGVDTVTVRQPLGVCVGIPPFNFPAMVPMWMFPMAIACGNAFVMKEVVDALLADPRVKAVSFVGSSPVARHIYETAGKNGKRVQAMGGAKNHVVVMPGCDLGAAVKAVLGAAYGCTGQRCLATSVVVAVGAAADPLIEELKKAASQISVGAGDDPKTGMGPVVNAAAKKRIEQYIQAGEQEGARLVADGREPHTHDGTEGFYVGPTIFDHVRPGMRIAREEIFGPVLSVIRAKDLDEAVSVVNSSEFGNAASIFTGAGAEGREFAARVQAGMVGVNVGVPAPSAFFPFAGWKGSFFGDLHALGRDAVQFYTETKVVTSRWPTPAREHKITF